MLSFGPRLHSKAVTSKVPLLAYIANFLFRYFGLRVPDPQFKDEKAKHPKPNSMYCQFPLVKYAEENKATWHEIAKKYDLDPTAYDYGKSRLKQFLEFEDVFH
jgi:hypothetical protein